MVGIVAPRKNRVRLDGPQVAREVMAGLAVAALEISFATSFAFFIFGAVSEDLIPRAAGLTIVGAGLIAGAVARATKVRGLIGGLQDAPAVVIAAMVATLATSVEPEALEATVFTFVLVVGVLLGIVLVLVGRFRLTTSARSLPFTVVSGFMAGTGWLLARAGVEVMVGEGLDWEGALDLFTWDLAKFWLPGLALALVAVTGQGRDRTGFLFPAGIVVLALAVHIGGQLFSSLDALRDGGWLLGPFPDSAGWQPVTPSEARDADWGAMVGQIIPVLGLFGVAVMGMVLNIAGLEMETGEDVDMEEEAISAGVATTAVSLLSGLPGFHQVGGTLMARRIGSRTPLASLVVLVTCVVVGVFGTSAVALLPKAVAGGVLLTVGFSILAGWVKQVRHQLSPFEGAMSAAILGSIIAFGVLTGIGVGLLAAVVGFVFSYSRVEPVRRVHRLATSRSVVDRPRADRLVLEENSGAMVGVELVGYLFFGSIRKVTDLVSPLLDSGDVRYLVMDFAAVRGLDASVVSGLQSIQRRTTDAGATIIWCGLTDEFEVELRRGGVEISDQRHEDLDHALEFVEEEVLHTASLSAETTELTPEEGDTVLLQLLSGRCERVILDRGEHLLEAGDECDEMFLIESGTLTAWGIGDDGRRARFRRVGSGSVIGEVAFIAGGTRTATVTADEPSTVLRLGADTFEKLCEDEPDLGLLVHAELAKRLAERLAYTSAAYQRSLRT
ncbi:MAG: SulP family inorganic anion transporter [Acidimicrobiia bacterium]|nr:SulP family inorganic anion transporter [Acidimicrobiia bacterium]